MPFMLSKMQGNEQWAIVMLFIWKDTDQEYDNSNSYSKFVKKSKVTIRSHFFHF